MNLIVVVGVTVVMVTMAVIVSEEVAVMDMEETIIFRIKSYCNRDGTTMLVVIMVVGGC